MTPDDEKAWVAFGAAALSTFNTGQQTEIITGGAAALADGMLRELQRRRGGEVPAVGAPPPAVAAAAPTAAPAGAAPAAPSGAAPERPPHMVVMSGGAPVPPGAIPEAGPPAAAAAPVAPVAPVAPAAPAAPVAPAAPAAPPAPEQAPPTEQPSGAA